METVLDRATLEDSERHAGTLAARRGHELGPFRASKQEPGCLVSFCTRCRHLVIVDFGRGEPASGPRFYGYALQSACEGADRSKTRLPPGRY